MVYFLLYLPKEYFLPVMAKLVLLRLFILFRLIRTQSFATTSTLVRLTVSLDNTLILIVPLVPDPSTDLAVIVTVPPATPFTTPFLVTVATFLLEELHVTPL